MKKIRGIAIALVALAASCALPAVRDEARWRLTELRGTERAYSAYVENASAGFPHRAEALKRLDALYWAEATGENTIVAYGEYIGRLDAPAHAHEAERRIRELRTDDRPFESAAKAGTAEAWWEFLESFPGHRRSGQALARLEEADSTNIFRLARAGRLDMTGQSDAIDRFGVVLEKRQHGAMTICIPRGAYWKAVDPQVQDMVATHGREDDLSQDGPLWYWTPTVGAGMRKRRVAYGDTFTLLPGPPSEDLARLIAFFVYAMPEFRLRQAATWIVTDNATLQDLRKYMRGQTGAAADMLTGDEDREFDSEEAINAIQIVEAAGFDPREYAIWKDRKEIFWELLAGDSYGWRYLASADSEGIGLPWKVLKGGMAQRVAAIEPRVLPILKATPVEVGITAPPRSRSAAWLAWYLRDVGNEVDCDVCRDEDGEVDIGWSMETSDTEVWFDNEVEAQGHAVAEIVRYALALRVLDADSVSITMQGGSLDIVVQPMGADDAEKERAALDQIPRMLRSMW